MRDDDYYLTGPRHEILHRAGCTRLAAASRPVGYPSAQGKSPTQLRSWLILSGHTVEDMRLCQRCLGDLEQLPEWTPPPCWSPRCGRPASDPIHTTGHGYVSEHVGRQVGYQPPTPRREEATA